MNRQAILLWALLLVLLSSCGRQAASPQDDGDTVAFKYASLLQVVKYDGYTLVDIRNPWKPGKLLHRYVLVPRTPVPSHLAPPSCATTPVASASGPTVIEVPIQRAAVFTTVHCALLTELGLGDRIVAVADAKYIKVPFVQQQVKSGRIADCGNGMDPVVEKIMDVKPEVIMLSPFENSGGYGKTEEIGIPLIECAEYMETSPLARAEWMRFYGLLYGVSDEADRLFQQVDSNYNALHHTSHVSRLTSHASRLTNSHHSRRVSAGPHVILDKMVGSVWYMPGGRSTIGQMLQDAGADYPWADDSHSGSLPLPFETVLERGGEADMWMLRYSSDHDLTYSELLSGYHGYSQLRAFRQKSVYGCNVEQSLFYEETPFHPDRLLSDFLKILFPDIPGLPPLRYYKKLKE